MIQQMLVGINHNNQCCLRDNPLLFRAGTNHVSLNVTLYYCGNVTAI